VESQIGVGVFCVPTGDEFTFFFESRLAIGNGAFGRGDHKKFTVDVDGLFSGPLKQVFEFLSGFYSGTVGPLRKVLRVQDNAVLGFDHGAEFPVFDFADGTGAVSMERGEWIIFGDVVWR
jgi:hypothetical protein